MLSKLFKKSNVTGRTIGDERQSVGLTFRTSFGGIMTSAYRSEDQVQLVNSRIKEQIDQLIQKGMVDEFTDPDMFDGLIKAQFALCHNDVEKTGVNHTQTIKSLLFAQQSEMLINRREHEMAMALLGEPVMPEPVKENKEVERDEEIYEK